jgi:ribosomal protein L37AE/L43A
MIKFTQWMKLQEEAGAGIKCPKCGEPTSQAELTAYRGQCENCWNRGKGTGSNPRSMTPNPKGQRVVHKSEPLAG